MKIKERISSYKGDIFVVKLADGNKRYFQYIATDMTQLNSSVVRVFKKIYPFEYSFKADEIISDEVDFYAHTMINPGQKMGFWEKVGKSTELGDLDIWFRTYQNDEIHTPVMDIRKGWSVWSMNSPMNYVGQKLTDEQEKMPLGIVYNPMAIVNKIKTGKTGSKTIIDEESYDLF